jgi:hypothetical protein
MMRLAGHVAHTGEMRNAYHIWLESLKETGHSEALGIDERIILKMDHRKI